MLNTSFAVNEFVRCKNRQGPKIMVVVRERLRDGKIECGALNGQGRIMASALFSPDEIERIDLNMCGYCNDRYPADEKHECVGLGLKQTFKPCPVCGSPEHTSQFHSGTEPELWGVVTVMTSPFLQHKHEAWLRAIIESVRTYPPSREDAMAISKLAHELLQLTAPALADEVRKFLGTEEQSAQPLQRDSELVAALGAAWRRQAMTGTAKACTCPLPDLIAEGCKCGGM